jgi:hypothetical protein
MTPDQQKRFDLLPVIRKQDRKGVELKGETAAALDESQSTLSSEVRSLGLTQRLEEDHRKTVAQVQASPGATDDLAALLQAPSPQASKPPSEVLPTQQQAKSATVAPIQQTKEIVKTGDKGAVVSAANAKALKPAVG